MVNDELNAFITVIDDENTVADSKTSSQISGMRIAVKDNICTKGIRTTAGSKMLSDYVPPYSATVVERLEEAGALIVGKTNMDEFAFGSTTETSYFGPVLNPYDKSRTAGGSSGGSAAAVASGLADAALGSDTGGSIRQPCAFCGVTGFKPTYGLVSRYGLIAYASSFDQIGPIAKDVKTCAQILDVISGYDDKDATNIDKKNISYTDSILDLENRLINNNSSNNKENNINNNINIKQILNGIRIAIPVEFIKENTDSDITAAVLKVGEELRSFGAEVEEIDLPLAEYAVPAYYVIACAQGSSNLARYDGVRYGYRTGEYNSLDEMYERTYQEGFGDEVRHRIELGRYVLSEGYYDEYYLQALKVRRLIANEYAKIYEKYDAILSPVTPSVAPKLETYKDDRISMYKNDIYTVAANLCGFPAISFPCGHKVVEDEEGNEIKLPIGAQLMGNIFSEDKLMKMVYIYENRRDNG